MLFPILSFSQFNQASFLPEQDGSGIPVSLLHVNNSKNQSQTGNQVENEESLSDADLDNIVGVGNNSELEVLLFMRKSQLC